MNYQSFLEMNVLISDPLLLELEQNKFTLILFIALTLVLFYFFANSIVRLIVLFLDEARDKKSHRIIEGFNNDKPSN